MYKENNATWSLYSVLLNDNIFFKFPFVPTSDIILYVIRQHLGWLIF